MRRTAAQQSQINGLCSGRAAAGCCFSFDVCRYLTSEWLFAFLSTGFCSRPDVLTPLCLFGEFNDAGDSRCSRLSSRAEENGVVFFVFCSSVRIDLNDPR